MAVKEIILSTKSGYCKCFVNVWNPESLFLKPKYKRTSQALSMTRNEMRDHPGVVTKTEKKFSDAPLKSPMSATTI